MPESLISLVAVVALALLTVAIVLAAIALSRLSALTAGRETAVRDAADLRTRLEVLNAQNVDLERDLRQDLSIARQEQAAAAQVARDELANGLARFRQAMAQQLTGMSSVQTEQLKQFGDRLATLTASNEQRLEAVRASVAQNLEALRADNTAKLEQMRATVDEKLQATLEQRLGQTFKQVSDRLDQVHRGLGEMQNLAAGVGDLKKVLTNVKSRGGWGEVQLGALLVRDAHAGAIRAERRDPPGEPRAGRVRGQVSGARRGRRALLAADRRQVSAGGLPAPAGGDRARRHRGGRGEPQGAGGILQGRSPIDPRQVCRAAAHHRFRDPVRADRRPVCGSGVAAGIGRRAAARVSRDAGGADEPRGDAQQPAARLSHAGDREALDRGLARARCGQDRVRQVRRDSRQDQGTARPGRQDARRRRQKRARRSRASCATSKRCRKPRPTAC